MEKALVKIDRTTAQEWLPMLINKKLFSEHSALKYREDVLKEKAKELGVDELTPAQQREFLSEIGEYKTNNFIVHDYGRYSIGFDLRLHKATLDEIEERITDDINDQDGLQKALSKISLYKLGHKLAMMILSEVYRQGTFKELVISKQKILSYLGYHSSEKQIYKDIDDALFALRYLNYVVYEYKNKISIKKNAEQTGNFIYNMRQDSTSYTLWINEAFIGCIEHVLRKDIDRYDDEDKKPLFQRGYFDYDTSLLSISKHYSTPGYLLAHFLTLDSGNAKLNSSDFKVVVYKASRFMEEAGITYARPYDRKKALLKAIKEVEIIDKTKPDVEKLSKIKSSQFEDEMIRIYIKK